MKNKEIEEVLNYYQKEIDKYEESKKYLMEKYGYDEETIDNISQHQRYKNNKLLLSYIEQLEKDKKELKDGWQQEVYDKDKVLNDWLEDERKINVLQNNRDKAIEYIKDNYDKVTTIEYDNNYVKETRYINNFDIEILLNILKGDSDE